MYILYQTDAWLSYSSRDLIAVCSTHRMAVLLAKCHAIRAEEPLSRDDEFNLINISQTQGREINYSIEKVPVNTLL